MAVRTERGATTLRKQQQLSSLPGCLMSNSCCCTDCEATREGHSKAVSGAPGLSGGSSSRRTKGVGCGAGSRTWWIGGRRLSTRQAAGSRPSRTRKVCSAFQLILWLAPGVSNEGGSSPLLVPLPAVSWPWVSAWGSMEPSRPGGENAQKTRKNGGKMGEIWPKKCEQGRDRRDQLGSVDSEVKADHVQRKQKWMILPSMPLPEPSAVANSVCSSTCQHNPG